MNPLLSIVIANYNYGRFLEDAIQSVLNQNVPEVELIIVDGGSADNSVDVIKKYSDKISWWVSEPDKGQSDAFNKGFAHARGKYLTWLNADDILLPRCLTKVIKAFNVHPECEWFTANMVRFRVDGTICEVGWGPHWYPFVLQRRNSPFVIFGPSTFFSKKLLDKVGPFDESLHMIMDTDMWTRFMLTGIKQRRINCFVWGFRMHELSKTAEFGEHVLTGKMADRMSKESRYFEGKHKYHQNRFIRLVCLLLRFLDGSLGKKIWYQVSLRNLNSLT